MIPAYVLLAPNCRSKEWKVFKGKVLVGVDSRSAAVTFPELTMKAEISLYKEPGIFKLRLSFSTDFVAFNFIFYVLLLWVWYMYHSTVCGIHGKPISRELPWLVKWSTTGPKYLTVQQYLSILWCKCIIVSSSRTICFYSSPFSLFRDWIGVLSSCTVQTLLEDKS